MPLPRPVRWLLPPLAALGALGVGLAGGAVAERMTDHGAPAPEPATERTTPRVPSSASSGSRPSAPVPRRSATALPNPSTRSAAPTAAPGTRSLPPEVTPLPTVTRSTPLPGKSRPTVPPTSGA